MNMDISQAPRTALDLRLEQNLSHQQIQALELLTAPVCELQSIINAELERNPVLEADFEQPEAHDDDAWLDHLLRLSEDTRYVCGTRPMMTAEDEERRQHFFDSATYEERLHDRLMKELLFLGLDEKVMGICEIIVCSLNNDGYITSHEADIAMAAGCTVMEVRSTVELVQGLNPPGIAARDLRERLLLQLDRSGRRDSIAWRIVANHLDDLAKNLLPKIARALQLTLPELKVAIAEIQGLNPHIVTEEASPWDYVREEIIVSEDDYGDLALQVCNDHLPSLRISQQYRELLHDPRTAEDVRDYIKQKVRAAAYLISSVIQRQSTIDKIAHVILDVQQQFFREGQNAMKPLTMAQVAERAGVHETTISRTVADKFLRCKWGIFPMKHFFSSGFTNANGEEVSSVAVKSAIRRLIDAEDATDPLSDSQLVSLLAGQGLKVARRTIAKYRESIGIPASNLRKQYCTVA